MPSGARYRPGQIWREDLFERTPAQVVAIARLLLAWFALLAIGLDPSQPDHHPATTYFVLALYVVHAAAMAAYVRWSTGGAFQVFGHAIDVSIIAALIYLTEGPTSPFFVLVTFALLSATLQWGARGALITAVLLATMQTIVTMIDGIREIDRFVMRSGYLIVGAGLFAYYGAYRDRMNDRLARLAAWPTEDGLDGGSQLDRLLAHTADVTRSSRVVVVWENEQEPQQFVAVWSENQATRIDSRAPGTFDELVSPEISGGPFILDPDRQMALTFMGARRLQEALNQAFVQDYGLGGWLVSAPFKNADVHGRIFCARSTPSANDLLSLAQIVADQVGHRLQHQEVVVRLERAAGARERERLAQDLHDGTLQAITAASLQLKQLADRAPDAATRDRLTEVRRQLADQQRLIRSFAKPSQPPDHDDVISLEHAIRATLSKIESVWNCTTESHVNPSSATITRPMQDQIDFIMMEAASNAFRHGKARKFSVTAHAHPERIQLRITNDGHALPNLVGTFDHEELTWKALGPLSIRNRVTAIGGRMALSSGQPGVELRMDLPRK